MLPTCFAAHWSGWKLGDGVLVDSMLHDGLTCAIEGWPMGEAAERDRRYVQALARRTRQFCVMKVIAERRRGAGARGV